MISFLKGAKALRQLPQRLYLIREYLEVGVYATAFSARCLKRRRRPVSYTHLDVYQRQGEGLQGLFRDLGANQIVSGGQTMNPCTEDILKAIHATPAQNVFVLPNNKNIIMAAEQAMKLADRNVCVLPSRTVPQGIAAMLAFDPAAELEQNQVNMSNALDTVSTCLLYTSRCV